MRYDPAPPTTTHAMISDPKLPFASDASDVRDFQSPPDPTNPLAPVSVSGLRPTPSPVHIWLRRMGVLLFVFLCATVGVMLMIVPWRPEWSDNPLLSPYPVSGRGMNDSRRMNDSQGKTVALSSRRSGGRVVDCYHPIRLPQGTQRSTEETEPTFSSVFLCVPCGFKLLPDNRRTL
jgi:hypothetical protein